jgi:2-oxoglutarate ferredoxin oxidoreductase subunit alpha
MSLEFLDGNEAVVRGAVRAGCNFFAGYPITPASTILQDMIETLPAVGGVAIQAEDEIASIGMCIGASMAGRKALTATSGPGISLYSENIGLAIMGEVPLVIVDVQRQGPATGSATMGAEGDIQFMRWVTSGGLPVICLSPASVAEAYELTYRAFNLAEKYRTPVFIASSKELGMTRESVDLEGVMLPPIVERTRASGNDEFLPHFFERPGEVPAFSDFGGRVITRFTTSTHDRGGYLTTNPSVIQEMIDHYAAKIREAEDDIALVTEDLEDGSPTLIVSYGITSRSVKVAVKEARARGFRVSSLVPKTLWPVPEKALRRAMEGVRRIVVPEMNMGQYVIEIQRLAPENAEVVSVGKMNTTLLSPTEILRMGGIA